MNIPEDLLYTKEHEWVKIEDDTAVIGISDYAQNELGDIVFIELPNVGDAVESMKPCGSIEAVKSVSDIYAPLSGEVTEVNQETESNPQIINQDPYGKGWVIKIRISEKDEIGHLLSAADYQNLVG